MYYRSPDERFSRNAAASGAHALVQEMRNDLNHVVATCELLKLELGIGSHHERSAALDKILAHAGSVSAQLQRLGPAATQDAEKSCEEACLRILDELQAMLPRIQSIAGSCVESPELALNQDLLQMEFAVHRLCGKIRGYSRASIQNGPSSNSDSKQTQAASVPAMGSERSGAAEKVILIADDDDANREMLARLLKREKHRTVLASNGEEVLQLVKSLPFDLLLLDVLMPGISGLDVLRELRSKKEYEAIPIVMVSGIDEVGSIAACIELGAEDYVLKPVNSTILRARVRVLLEKKQAREWEQSRTRQLQSAYRELESQKRKTDLLLQNILPQETAEELKKEGRVSPKYFENATIVFTDFVSFTASTEALAADDLVIALNDYFTAFDAIVDRYQLERLKTVGDSYIFMCGLPKKAPSHPVDAVLASMEMLDFVKQRQETQIGPTAWSMRIGINTGPVIAGVVGTRKFAFDVWGETVNSAARMVSACLANKINISGDTFQRVKEFFTCTPRGEVRIKGNRWREMFFVDDVLPALLGSGNETPPLAFALRYADYFHRELVAFPRCRRAQPAVSDPDSHLGARQVG
jgi:class 3 adenylate cyclase/CheY-like chemotaxis protein